MDRLLSLLAVLLGLSLPLSAQILSTHSARASEAGVACSGELTDVVDALMLDLPGYANRVIQRQRVGQRENGIWRSAPARTYVLLAGQPTVESLPPLEPLFGIQSGAQSGTQSGAAPLYRVFFTTLERQYFQASEGLAEPRQVQQFHQLVLAQVEAPESWRVIRLRSQLAPYPAGNQILSPLRNADDGAMARAIRLWLRDCAATSLDS